MKSKLPYNDWNTKCLSALITFCLFFICFSSNSFAQSKDPTIGITNNTGFNTNPDFVQRTINYDKDLGIYKVRMGMDGVGGYNENDSFNWDARDATVNKYIAEGFTMHCVIAARAHTNRYTTWDQWKRNFEYFCRNVMEHYKGKITYYIVDNEPDLGYGAPIGPAITPAQAVEFTKIAFTAAQSIDPNIRIESPPTMSPETSYLRDMISMGVTQYCHYLGIHAYGSQIDDGRLSKPWEYMSQFYNFPQRPVALSETGTNPNWHPAGVDGLAWQARWFEQLNVAVKRYGFDNVLLYRLDEGGAEWDILNKPAYNAIKNAYLNKSITNGGFETTTSFLDPNEWMMYFSADAVSPPTNITVTNAEKHSGSTALSINGAGQVRQILGNITPGKQVTVSVWVKATNGGSARLTIQGYNKTAGDAELIVSSNSSEWTLITAKVTPSNSFCVAELESIEGNCFFDDVLTIETGEDEIYISNPSNNTIFQVSDSTGIKIDANVTDADNSIANVEFYAGSNKIGESSIRPFSYSWTGVPEGNYALTVKALNSSGVVVSTSSAVMISVKDPSVLKVPDLVVRNISWTPAIISNGTPVSFNATVKNNGTGATKEGVIIGGAFLLNGSVVNWTDTYKSSLASGDSVIISATGGPSGSANWIAVSGYYTLQFIVDDINRIDESDENNNSYATTLCVASPDGNPHVKINTPENATVIPLGQIVKIDVTAADCEGFISMVELFADGVKVGEVKTAPYIFDWSTIKSGISILKAVATDNEGNTSETSIQVTGQISSTYEAENAVITKALVKGRYGASGGKAVGSIDFDDSSVEFNVYVSKTGLYKVKVAYSNGMGTPSSQNLYINGASESIVLQYAPTNNWDTFSTLEIYAQLQEGRNQLIIKKGDLYGEVDCIKITLYDPNLIFYEAEDAIINNANIGYKSGASGGKYVGGIFDNSFIDFQFNSKKGAYTIKVGYANGMGSESSFLIRVNDEPEYALTVPPTANWDVFGSVMDTLELKDGRNNIIFRRGNMYADLDYILLTYIIPVDTIPPTMPGDLTVKTTTNEAVLNWTPSIDNNSKVSYIIYKDNAAIDTLPEISATISGLTVNTTYSFAVSAIDSSGNQSGKAYATATTIDTDAPSTPVNLTGKSTSKSISVSWEASSDNVGVKNYNIYLEGELLKTVEDTFALIENLEPAKQYTIEVNAVDEAGNTSERISATFTTKPKGIEDNLPGGGVVKIYPNPFENQFKVTLTERTSHCDIIISVFSSRGRLVAISKLNERNGYETTIDMTNQKKGVYILVMFGKNVYYSRRVEKL